VVWRRHGWLTEEEVVVDAEMRGERKPEIGGLGRIAGIRGGLSGGEGLAGGRGCPAPAAREVGGGMRASEIEIERGRDHGK
jgi:hypothetical protein